MGRIKMSRRGQSIAELFDDFIEAKRLDGLSEATIRTYQTHFTTISSFWDVEAEAEGLTQQTVNQLILALAEQMKATTVQSYSRTLRTFFNWTDLSIKVKEYRAAEQVKETFTEAELKKLLRKPNIKTCTFNEYKCWVIVNLLMNCGCRAGTVIEIKIEDLDLNNRLLTYRHNKNGHIQTAPLCTEMIKVLRGYLKIRGGEVGDYLFINTDYSKMSYNSLRLCMKRYIESRGVELTSIHAFRHTFAKMYVLNGGDPIRLQRLLGHSTLAMSQHYCQIYGGDLVEGYDDYAPLSTLNNNPKRRHKI